MPLHARAAAAVLLAVTLAACGAASAPEKAFQAYRQAVVDRDYARAWSWLSPAVQESYGGSPGVYSSEMKGFFARPDLRLQFETTEVLGVEIDEEGGTAVLRASHETVGGASAERTWRLVKTDEGWKLDEL
jgi:hypothetical protein